MFFRYLSVNYQGYGVAGRGAPVHDPVIPPMLTALVQTGIAMLDRHRFEILDSCPSCGGEVSGYDFKMKKFARIRDNSTPRDVMVRVKRYECRVCGRISFARAPFYPETNLGGPIVDLCIVLSRSMPFHRAARVMGAMGIVVDRGTVRKYSGLAHEIPTMHMFGLELPISILSLSTLTIQGEGGSVHRAEPLRPGGLPPADRAPEHRMLPEERGQREEEQQAEERHTVQE
jgi:hypothetical protein